MEDLHNVGGTPAVLKYLLEKGYLHGDCLTVTGATLAENLAPLPGLTEGQVRSATACPRPCLECSWMAILGPWEMADTQDVVHPVERPIKATGHLQIMYGNLAPTGAVAKITGKEGLQFRGPARVFDDEQRMVRP